MIFSRQFHGHGLVVFSGVLYSSSLRSPAHKAVGVSSLLLALLHLCLQVLCCRRTQLFFTNFSLYFPPPPVTVPPSTSIENSVPFAAPPLTRTASQNTTTLMRWGALMTRIPQTCTSFSIMFTSSCTPFYQYHLFCAGDENHFANWLPPLPELPP